MPVRPPRAAGDDRNADGQLTRAGKLLLRIGIDPRSRWLSVEVEPKSRATESLPRRVASLSLKVKGLTLAQFPNAPLAVAFVAGLVSMSVAGSVGVAAKAAGVVATTVWAYAELAHGVNWFRHALGLYSLGGIALGLIGLLHG